MTDAVLWPPCMRPSDVMFHPDQPSRSGGRSIAGREQVIVSMAGAWRAKLGFTTVQNQRTANGINEHLVWRAMLAILEGRTNNVLVGPYDASTPAKLSGVDYSALTTFDDDTTFSDGSHFSQFATPVECAADAARGATSLIASMIGGHTPQPGQYFGTYNRLYIVKRADLVTGNSPDIPNQYTLRFWPPLRVAIGAGAALNFDSPVCEMRFAADSTGELTIRPRNQASSPSIDLVEVF